MKRCTGVTLAVIAVSGSLMLAPGLGWGKEGAGQGKGERDKQRGEFRQEIKAHFQQQREENKEFRGTLKDKPPAEAVAAIKTHREQQYNENKTFLDAEYAKLVEAIKAKLAGKEGGDAKLEDILRNLEARHAEREQKMGARHTELMGVLTQLSQKQDLTWEDVREAMKAFHAKHAGERKGEGKGQGKARGEGRGHGRQGQPRVGEPGLGV